MNDYGRKTTFSYRPRWDGALLQPEGGAWQSFVTAGRALFRPTDMETGPDGALWVLSWGKLYNRPQKLVRSVLGQTEEREGRVFRIVWKGTPLLDWRTAKRERPLERWSFAELAEDLGSHLPVWRTDAQEELLRRGPAVQTELLRLIETPELPTAQETWALWTLGRMDDAALDASFTASAAASLNRRIQSLRITAHRARAFARPLPAAVAEALRDSEPRIRFAAVQAIREARAASFTEALKSLAASETDRITFYSAWGALRDLADADALRAMLQDPRDGVRRAALLALADLGQISPDDATALVTDPATTEVAALWLARRSGNPFITFEPQPGEFEREVTVFITPGIKPSVIRYTLDGSVPTEQSALFPESTSIVLKNTTTLKAALFVEGKPVGEAAEAVFTKRTGEPAAAVVLQPRARPTTIEQSLAALKTGQPERGRALFTAAGCVSCHRAGNLGREFGPDLINLGERGEAGEIVRSIIEPNAAITEGFALLSVGTRDGKIHVGILREETDRHLTLGQAAGQPVRVEKALITQRESLHTSAMPPFGGLLAPGQVADIVSWLMAQKAEGRELADKGAAGVVKGEPAP
jgi:putative heme-binding domain-containing protein